MKFVKFLIGICLVAVSSLATAGWFGPTSEEIDKMTEEEIYTLESKRDYGPTESWSIAEGARYAQIYAYIAKRSAISDVSNGVETRKYGDSGGASSAVADSGGAVVVGSALDLVSGRLGWGMNNSVGLNGGMLALGLVGVMLGSGDKALDLKEEYRAITIPGYGKIRIVNFDESSGAVGDHIAPSILRAFYAGRQLMGELLSAYNCKRLVGSQVSTTAAGHERDLHQRTYGCVDGVISQVRVHAQIIGSKNSLAKEPGMLGKVFSTVEIITKDTPGIMAQIRDKIPEGWYAVYPSEKDGKKAVMVVTKDREMAFDPPPDPFISIAVGGSVIP